MDADIGSSGDLDQKTRHEALDAINDRLERLTWMLADCRQGAVEHEEAMKAIKIDVHGIKSSGSIAGLFVIAILAHRFEDYLVNVSNLADRGQLEELQQFLDCLQDGVDKGADVDNEDIAALVRKLPTHGGASFDIEDVVATDVEVMLVVPRGVAGKMVAQELMECGYRVVSVADPFEAMQFVISAKPDVIIVSAILERLDGVDLVCALKAMPSTRHIPVACLTSLEDSDGRLKLLPKGVPVLHKGGSFADDVAEAFASLKIT